MNTSMIKIEGLTFSYGKKASVFQDFSLEMEAGKVIGLLGKNGTGKSTLLYLMSGLLRPQSGSVWMKERDVQKRLPVTLEDMYLVPEEFTLPNLSLKQFVKVNAPFYPRFSQEPMVLRNSGRVGSRRFQKKPPCLIRIRRLCSFYIFTYTWMPAWIVLVF